MPSAPVSVLLLQTADPGAPDLRADLTSAGFTLAGTGDCTHLVREALRTQPDAVVCWAPHVDEALLQAVQTLQREQSFALVVFTRDSDVDLMQRALDAGVHAWVVQGYGPQRLRPLLAQARLRERRERAWREQVADLEARLEERKLVDKAKGILMRASALSEDEAFRVLRNASMQGNQKVGQVSRQVIAAARVAEAINRAGQQRMLSQRLVKLHALACSRTDGPAVALLMKDSVSVATKNTAAAIPVERDRKLDEPLAPNRLPEVPEPKAAPMSAPLPCCTSTRPITPRADSICTTRIRVIKTLIVYSRVQVLAASTGSGTQNGQKVDRLEGSPTDQATIHIRLCQQFGGVGRVHAAAIKDGHTFMVRRGRLELRTQHSVYGLSLLGCSRAARANGPDGFVSHHDFADAVTVFMDHSRQLALDHRFGLACIALRQRLTHTDNRGDATGQRLLGLEGHIHFAFAVVLAAFGVTHDAVTHAKVAQHGGRHLTGVGT